MIETKPLLCPDCGNILTEANAFKTKAKFYKCKCISNSGISWNSWMNDKNWYKWHWKKINSTGEWRERKTHFPKVAKFIFDPSYKSGEKRIDSW